MPNYLVSYDLDETGLKDYSRLENRLRALGATRLRHSQWLLKYPLPVSGLESDFMQCVNPSTDGFLIVAIVPGNTAWNKLMISDDDVRRLLAE